MRLTPNHVRHEWCRLKCRGRQAGLRLGVERAINHRYQKGVTPRTGDGDTNDLVLKSLKHWRKLNRVCAILSRSEYSIVLASVDVRRKGARAGDGLFNRRDQLSCVCFAASQRRPSSSSSSAQPCKPRKINLKLRRPTLSPRVRLINSEVTRAQ